MTQSIQQRNLAASHQKFDADAYMQSVSSVRKYWREIARYPLYPQALIIAVLMGLLPWAAMHSNWVGVLVVILGMGFLAQYLIGVVQETALGHAHPPPIVEEVGSQPGYLRPALLLLYMGVLIGLDGLLTQMNLPVLIYPLLAAGMLLLPAFAAVLAVVDDFREAGNPLRLRHFIFNTQGGYLAIALPMILLAWIGQASAGGVISLLCFLATAYLLVALCHLLGFVACHRYAELNADNEFLKQGEDTRRRNAQQDTLDALLKEIDMLTDAGDPRSACDIMFREHDGLSSPLQFHEQLYQALRARDHDVLTLVQGKRLIHMLMHIRHVGRALTVYEQCLDISTFFKPWEMAGTLQLAESALQEKRLQLFDKIVTSVVLQYPGSAETIALQFRRVRYLLEVEKNEAAALAGLKPLLSAEADPLYPRIIALYRALTGKAA
ncbi:MAG TPA: hypothetical protein VFX47_07800 [Gammaproteobacteria bacterium]|nr:hypothetical protein [Gammaproteobacteria bacterium]